MHDSRRVRQERNETKELAKFEKEVKGGFPCFSRNLPVFSASRKDRFIKLKTSRIGEIVQVQNMKWDADERNIAYKKAYLRSLLLHVYAELFCSRTNHPRRTAVPHHVKWYKRPWRLATLQCQPLHTSAPRHHSQREAVGEIWRVAFRHLQKQEIVAHRQ